MEQKIAVCVPDTEEIGYAGQCRNRRETYNAEFIEVCRYVDVCPSQLRSPARRLMRYIIKIGGQDNKAVQRLADSAPSYRSGFWTYDRFRADSGFGADSCRTGGRFGADNCRTGGGFGADGRFGADNGF